MISNKSIFLKPESKAYKDVVIHVNWWNMKT